MDIGAIVKAPLDDKDWIKKCVLIGLISLIPVAGWFNFSGWYLTYSRNRLVGNNELPEANLNYMGLGFSFFVAMLPLVGVFIGVIVLNIAVGAVSSALGTSIPSLLVGLATFVFILALAVVAPLFAYRYVVHDDTMAGARIGWALGVVREHTGAVGMLWVATIVGAIVQGVGSAVFIGGLITVPLGTAMMGAAIVEFAKATNRA